MDNIAVVFPGQGTQYVGMGRDLYEAFPAFRKVFDQAEEILGYDIARLCFEGPQATLDLTVNTQITILTMEMALFEAFREFIPVTTRVMAGHSLGEYSAIYAAGAIELSDILPLVQARARYHQDAVPVGVGAMAAIIGLDDDEVRRICAEVKEENETVDISVLNAPKQVTISGHAAAVEKVMAVAKERKALSAVKLPISAPCHSQLLNTASDWLRQDLNRVGFKDFRVPVIPNCDPETLYTKENVRDLLEKQIVRPVRWQQTIEKMAAMDIDTIVEIGPKKTLSNLIKRIDKRFRLLDIVNVESFRKVESLFKK